MPAKKKLKKHGRPKIEDSMLKRHNLTIRLSDKELLILDKKVKSAGFSSYSTFLREASLGRELPKTVPEVNLKTFLELGRLGANFNQMLKRCHLSNSIEVGPITQLLRELHNIVQDVQKEVRGYDWQAEDRQSI